jgi:hypothetical protein
VASNRGIWVKTKCLNQQEFVVGWTDPECSRPYLGSLLLGYYRANGSLIYAGRAGTGMDARTLAELKRRLAAPPSVQVTLLPPAPIIGAVGGETCPTGLKQHKKRFAAIAGVAARRNTRVRMRLILSIPL